MTWSLSGTPWPIGDFGPGMPRHGYDSKTDLWYHDVSLWPCADELIPLGRPYWYSLSNLLSDFSHVTILISPLQIQRHNIPWPTIIDHHDHVQFFVWMHRNMLQYLDDGNVSKKYFFKEKKFSEKKFTLSIFISSLSSSSSSSVTGIHLIAANWPVRRCRPL